MKKNYIFSICILVSFYTAHAKVWQVGTGKTYTVPSQVAGLVAAGDTVNIDAGTYVDCATWNANNLLLRGIGGMAHIKDVVCSGKGIWNFNGNNITVEYIEFSGAANPSLNGAGIRGQGGKFTVRYCYFHDNENGILCNDPVAGASDVLVEYSEFANNGQGDGYSHNMYIGNMKSFTLRYSYTHHAKIGHEIKSRANQNYILYNRISDEAAGTASRSIDLPNGGLAIVLGNLIEQGPNSGNSNIFGYGLEGLSNPAPQNVYVINNTFVNDKSAGSFVNVASGTNILKMTNNIFAGTGTVISGTAAALDTATNWITTNKTALGLVNVAGYDYQLTATSPAIDKGSNPGMAGTYSLMPVSEYVHNSNKRIRLLNGLTDIGAYEYNHATGLLEVNENVTEPLVYPNPFNDQVTFEVNDMGINSFSLIIYDALGRAVKKQEKIQSKKITVDRSGMENGIYLFELRSEEKIIDRGKLMVK